MAVKAKNDTFARYMRAEGVGKQRIVGGSFGEVGTGKTSFWLGAPAPIVVQTLDQGLEGVVEHYTRDGKEIYVAEYDLGQTVGSEYTHERASVARDKFIADFEHAIQHARTIIWDRESDAFNMFSYAESGTTDKYGALIPKDWEKLKGSIRRLIAMAKASDVNFGVIQGMRDEWAKGKMGKTGVRVRDGMEGIDALMHINLEHTRNGKTFGINVGKARGPGGHDIQDQSFENLCFAEFAQLVFPDSNASDWE
ncbi:MAG: hypothetical protein V4498_03235 [candidate division FCPU426 bacterium]